MFAMHEIAFDEAGNTGADLLNVKQPVFALASVSLSRSEANEILEGIRTPQANEVKFSRLRRSEPGWRRILKALSSPDLTSEKVVVMIIHKRFMAVAKIVDLLVETLAHEDSVDLHKDGANIALSNLHFICMPTFCGKDWTETFLCRFVDMVRQRTPNSVRKFYQAARVLYELSSSRKYAELLAPILVSQRLISEILPRIGKNTLDPAIPAFVRHCVLWGERFEGAFDLVHDASKPIFQEKETLEDLMSRGEEEHLIGYDRRKFIFPLRARCIQFGKSEEDPRLQIADLVAGACANCLATLISPGKDQAFFDEVAASFNMFVFEAIWPTSNISPRELGTEHTGGINAIDYMAEFFSKHRR
jgi:hypothetical protein